MNFLKGTANLTFIQLSVVLTVSDPNVMAYPVQKVTIQGTATTVASLPVNSLSIAGYFSKTLKLPVSAEANPVVKNGDRTLLKPTDGILGRKALILTGLRPGVQFYYMVNSSNP